MRNKKNCCNARINLLSTSTLILLFFLTYFFPLNAFSQGHGTDYELPYPFLSIANQMTESSSIAVNEESVLAGDFNPPVEAYCGWYTRPTPVDTPNVEFSDRFGNLYTRSELSIPTPVGSRGGTSFDGCDCEDLGISTGYFDLWFEDCIDDTYGFSDTSPGITGSGLTLGEERRKVACTVFAEIAQMVQLADKGGCNPIVDRKVNVQIKDSNDQIFSEEDAEVAAVASPYFLFYHPKQDGLPWQIINSTEYPLTHVGFYHSHVKVNFHYFNFWNGIDSEPSNNSLLDLYSVLWHEALHTLGFYSLAINNDSGLPNYSYSRFDRFMNFHYSNGDIFNLIDLNGVFWNINSNINPATDFYNGCQDPTPLGPDVFFNSTSGANYPILSDDADDNRTSSSFSHLESDCDSYLAPPYFLMNRNIWGGIRRTITSEEQDILCSLGYTLNTCGCTVAGADDFGPSCDEIYQISICETQEIRAIDILSNDNLNVEPENGSIAFLGIRNPLMGGVLDNLDGTFTFTPYEIGVAVLAYIPVGCEGQEGGFTNIYIQVTPDSQCPDIYNCVEEEDFPSCTDIPVFSSCEDEEFNYCDELSQCNLICNPVFCGIEYSIRNNAFGRPYLNMPYLFTHANFHALDWVRTHGGPRVRTDGTFRENADVVLFCSSNEGETNSGQSDGIMTLVDFSEGQYFLSMDYSFEAVNNQMIPSFKVDLIESDNMNFPPEIRGGSDYSGSSENIFNTTTPQPLRARSSSCFSIGSNNTFNALWFHLPIPNEGHEGQVIMDNIELIKDEFELGSDPNAIICGSTTDIGADFCMLSEVGIHYKWEAITTNSTTTVLEYTVMDGAIIGDIVNPNGWPFDEDTRLFTVMPLETTTYRLTRSVDSNNDGGIPNLLDDSCVPLYDEVTVEVLPNLPQADFTYTSIDECTYVFTPDHFNGENVLWKVDGIVYEPTDVQNGSLEISLDNGSHSISLSLESICGQSSTEQTLISNCCLTPDISISEQDEGCGVFAFSAINNDPNQSITIWTWEFGLGEGGSNGQYGQHMYMDAGDYTVTLTATNDCDETSSVSQTITVLEYLPSATGINVSQDPENPCTYTFTVENSNLVATYSWDFDGDGVEDLNTNESIVEHTFLSGGNTSIVVILENECTAGLDNPILVSVLVDVEECVAPLVCECPPDGINLALPMTGKLLSDLINEGQLPPESISLHNKCMAISGKLIVDQLYSIGNGQIIMNPGSEIEVTSRLELKGVAETYDGVHQGVYGCNNMWKGITVGSNDAQLVVESSYIQDAEYAINALHKSHIYINGSHFDRNFISLFHDGLAFYLTSFLNNTFSGDQALLPPYAGYQDDPSDQLPAIGTVPFTGVYIDSRLQATPYHFQGTSTFKNLPNGMIARNGVNLIVEDTRFENIQKVAGSQYDPMGYGIFLKGGVSTYQARLDQSGMDDGSASFKNCFTGIWSTNAEINISDNVMQNMNTGIQTDFVDFDKRIQIKNNEIEAFSYGIRLRQTDRANNIAIFGNSIYLEETLGRIPGDVGAISILENQNRADNAAAVFDNDIWINKKHGQGIYAQSANNWVFRINTIISGIYENTTGIRMIDGLGNSILENEITGNGSVQTLNQVGMNIKNTTDTDYTCNTVHSLNTGVKFESGTSTMTNISGNTFEPPFEIGLYYNKDLMIDIQEHHWNEWQSGTYLEAAAQNDIVTFSPIDVQEQRYLVASSNPPLYPQSISMPNAYSGAENDWFQVLEYHGDPQEVCRNTVPEEGETELTEGDIKRSKSLVENGGTWSGSIYWEADRQFYRKIQSNTWDFSSIENILNVFDINTEDAEDLKDFYGMTSSGNINKYYDINTSLSQLYYQNETVVQEVNSLIEDRDYWLEQLVIINHQLQNDEDNTSLWTERENVLGKLHTNAELIGEGIENIYETVDQGHIALQALHQSIITNADYELNEKQWLDVYLQTLAKSNLNFTSSQKDILLQIAQQCPQEAGRSVYKARSLYRLIDDEMEFEDSCETIKARSQQDNNNGVQNEDFVLTDQKMKFRVYPNPVKDILYISYNLTSEGYIELYDLYGKVIRKITLLPTQNEVSISVSDIHAGLYMLRIYSEHDDQSSTQKVLITK